MAGEKVAAFSPRFFSTAIRTASSIDSVSVSAPAAEKGYAQRSARRSDSPRRKEVFKGVAIRYIIAIRARETPQRLHHAPMEPAGTLPPSGRIEYNERKSSEPGVFDAETAFGRRDLAPLLRGRLRRPDRPQRRQADGNPRNEPRGDQG